MPWPVRWDRGNVLGAIEEASGVSLSADDPLPDTLIAKAQELGLMAVDLRLWIYDRPNSFTADELVRWAQRYMLDRSGQDLSIARPLCGHCGELVDDPGNHECNGRGPVL